MKIDSFDRTLKKNQGSYRTRRKKNRRYRESSKTTN